MSHSSCLESEVPSSYPPSSSSSIFPLFPQSEILSCPGSSFAWSNVVGSTICVESANCRLTIEPSVEPTAQIDPTVSIDPTAPIDPPIDPTASIDPTSPIEFPAENNKNTRPIEEFLVNNSFTVRDECNATEPITVSPTAMGFTNGQHNSEIATRSEIVVGSSTLLILELTQVVLTLLLRLLIIIWLPVGYCSSTRYLQIGRVDSVLGIFAGIVAADVAPAPDNASGILCTYFVIRAGYLPHHHVVTLRIAHHTISRTFATAVGLFPAARSASSIVDSLKRAKNLSFSFLSSSASGIADTHSKDHVGYHIHLHHPNDALRTSLRSVSHIFVVDVGLSPVARSASDIVDTPSKDHVGYHLHHPNDAPGISRHSASRTFLVVVGLSPVAGSTSGIFDNFSMGPTGYLPRQTLRTFLHSVVGTVVAGVGLALAACNAAGTAGTAFEDHVGSLLCHLSSAKDKVADTKEKGNKKKKKT
ncbi:hypothetical protein NE237_022462 [Protea cynaroides]|uniref:Uncharacterized protein n=1 Tax=Protea cynaroides TaxID=273540 RepID=A0A9Q0K5U9_9MAGN|nr:hypothetical protein NE237_022462 [Protea cynaroides]